MVINVTTVKKASQEMSTTLDLSIDKHLQDFMPPSKQRRITAKLICAFVFASADCWFSHAATQFLFAITADGVVPVVKRLVHCADYFFFWSFEISEDILRNQKFIIGLG